jgi:hypothetical protein
MIHDKLTQFLDATSVAASAGTALVGSQIDLGKIGLDLGVGEPVWLTILTTTEIITGGSAGTILFKLASDSTASIAVDGSATVHITTDSFVTDGTDANDTELKAGGIIFSGPLPIGTYERYLGILCVTGTTTTTAGNVDAFLSVGPIYAPKAYPDGI